MRSLLALLTMVLLGLGATACGGGSKGAGSVLRVSSGATAKGGSAARIPSNTVPTRPQFPGDTDRPSDRRYDKDDDPIRHYGHAASAADERAVTGLVKRYYAAAAAGDGAKACSLIYSLFAKSIVEDYGRPPGPPALRGKTCGAVMSKLFKQRRRQREADNATLKVTGMRVEGNQAYVLLSATTMPVGYTVVKRERDAWKMNAFLGGPMA